MNEEEVYLKIQEIYAKIQKEIGKVVIGQEEVLEQIMVCILTDNHALLEGFPGLGKTLLVSSISKILELKFSRIQCTPDIMPSDIMGTYIIEETDGKKNFRFEQGPVFANIVLADEINRATPKSQSALLEAMQERQVTVGKVTHPLEKPFFVLATQNPIEMEGTYPLPEAQLDRFLLKISVGYPAIEDERKIVDLYTSEYKPDIGKILDRRRFLILNDLTRKMPISNEMKQYALNIVCATRPQNGGEIASKYIDYGASPRASIGLVLAAKARALLHGRSYVNKEDVETMAFPVLRHRIILNFESDRKGITQDDIIGNIIKRTK